MLPYLCFLFKIYRRLLLKLKIGVATLCLTEEEWRLNRKIVMGIVLMLFLTLPLVTGISERSNLVEESRSVVKKVGVVKEIGIGVYWDSGCSSPVSFVDWGDIAPGSSKNISVFMRNEGNTSVNLFIYTSNWNPSEAADFVHLTWNYTGEIIEESHVLPATLSLHVHADIRGISTVAFDANIGVAQESIKTVVSIAMFASISPPTWTVDVDPDALNLKSKGRWVTCYIKVSEGYNVSDIDRTTLALNGTIPVDKFWVDKPLESVVGDYDNDTLSDLMVKFDRQALIEYLKTKGITVAEVTLAITAEANGISFEATDTIKVIGQ